MTRFRSASSGRRTLPLRALRAAGLLLATAGAAHAADTAPPSPNATENLVRLMVEKNLLTKEQADGLIAQAQAEAKAAQTAPAATPKADDAAPAPNGATPPANGTVRVQYVPESVKQQLRDDLRQEIMDQAKAEGWAAPGTVPDWVSRFTFFGDLRVRAEARFYPTGNAPFGQLPNFNAINNGSPYDTSAGNPHYAPQLNDSEDRDRIVFRARGGMEVDLGEGFTAGMRLASGATDAPVTMNQTFGANGGFTTYAVWIDRAFLKFEPHTNDDRSFALEVGRFDNPFFSTPLIWSNDIGFDGAAVTMSYNKTGKISPFFAAGAFPIGNTALNFSSDTSGELPSHDAWLYAAQVGVTVKPAKDFSFKAAGAYYDFTNVQGQLSSPFVPIDGTSVGSTDNTRPGYAQNGNTYMQLRDILPVASNSFGTTDQFQYYGLASQFRVLAITTTLDYAGFDPYHVWIDGEFLDNLAFNQNAFSGSPVNNLSSSGAYQGGNIGWITTLNFGHPVIEKRWDWNVSAGYRYLESDATPDGYNDNDFGNGGTNLKGYTLAGSLGVAKRVWVRVRWMSAESIAGPTFKANTLQLDINARF